MVPSNSSRHRPDRSHATARAPKPATPPRPADASRRSVRVIEWLTSHLPPQLREKALDYLVLTRMDRPIGALLLLWPTWWALWLAAGGFPPLGIFVIFTVGVFLMRSAGCVMNDYADRHLDPQVARTAGRPIACGRVQPREALLLFTVLLLLAFGLVLLTNTMTIKLAFVGAALAALYPFSKRYTQLPQVVLGATFGWSIPMAFAAVSQKLPPLVWLLFLGNVLWSTIYDTEYAMVDREDDIRAGAKSTAILFGEDDRMILGVLMVSFMLTMALVGHRAGLDWPYWLGLLGSSALFGLQQWTTRKREPAACLAAFRQNNWVGLLLWASMAVALAYH